jgi:cell division transport system permease protein
MSMKISSFKHYISDAVKSLIRNKTISIASILTVTATLFILGVFLLTVLNVRDGIVSVESMVEIRVFLNDEITETEQSSLETALKQHPGVREVEYESKEEALEKFREQMAEDGEGLLSGLDGSANPLPDSFIVRLTSPEKAEEVVEAIKNMGGIDTIKNDRELVNILMSISRTIRWVGVALFALLIGVSLFLIGNTIRLTVFSRRREIGIMKFVGATDWFIRWPFVIEGVIIGLFGAIFANIVLFYAYRYAFVSINESWLGINLIAPSYVYNVLMGQFALAGIGIGVLGSVISLRKFLNV